MELSSNTLPPIAVRSQRTQTAVALGTPDRVPFIPTIGNMYCLEYGVTIKDAMKDARSVIPAMDTLCREMDPDVLFAPTFFPEKTLRRLNAAYFSWPGKTPDLGDNAPYQMADGCFLEEEDYDAFLRDPSSYLMTQVLPKKYPALAGLSGLNLYSLCSTTVMGFGALGIPPVQEALQAFLDAGQSTLEYLQGMTELCLHAVSEGYPLFGHAVALNPFDDFADCIRGLVNTVMDLAEDPAKLAEAVSRYADVTIPAAIDTAKMQHAEYLFVPLHAGMDEFMSPEDYEQYYWPPLRRLIDACIENSITPMLMCEGNYYSRLETLKQVPKGKVVYFFEKQDMKEAKRVLGDTACIAGNMSTETLMHGTPERVVEETRRLLDICAPGGGYIMSNSMSLDACSRENVAAWAEATRKYGAY
ncbi:MAG: uroporphyrinogen decarboxylase family protein [Eubacterium sp.]|jgi:hypothetical protein|uniref:uroporphyrinogen decarboxylase family protein n=1 Tax=Clostridium sp. (strain SY8519) TaxID=1042156 RepID=UPI0002172079|nr:uroporphyrinogen decarboxylase family protein [Clostridium sp. SY8519]BAK47910.1 hypothetical protein CXIVA_19430 [Clostridium sp. SY8519]